MSGVGPITGAGPIADALRYFTRWDGSVWGSGVRVVDGTTVEVRPWPSPKSADRCVADVRLALDEAGLYHVYVRSVS